MITNEKIYYFEYTLYKLLEWYKDIKGDSSSNDLSILKSLKLLFFVSAARASTSNNRNLVDSVFNSYCAMPFGHVESDIYDYIKTNNGVLNFYKINSFKTELRNPDTPPTINSFDNLATDLKEEINLSVGVLRASNKYFILISPFALVDLSHAWFSWQSHYKNASSKGVRSEKIPSDTIKTEDKIFSLQTF